MNFPRLILAMVAGFILIFATDYLIHGVWLMPNYNATKSIWRPDAQVNARVRWMFIAQFIFAATFVIIWALGFAGRGIGAACVVGLLIGLFQEVWAPR